VLCSVSAYLPAPLPGAAALVLHLGVAAARRRTGGAGEEDRRWCSVWEERASGGARR